MKETGILLIAAFSLVLMAVTGCDKISKLMPNTEAYIQAHGIELGKVNTLQIGGTLFRFPAGVGLNPYTSDPEKIVKGHADMVTLYLNSKNNYAPGKSPYQSGDVRVSISKRRVASWDGVHVNLDSILKIVQGEKFVDDPDLGLREYIPKKPWLPVYYEVIKKGINTYGGYGPFTYCNPTPEGFDHPSGYCYWSYWNEKGEVLVQVVTNKSFFLKSWQKAYPAVVNFVNSVVVK